MGGLRIWQRPTDATEEEGGGGMQAVREEEVEGLGRAEVKAFWTLYIDVVFISLDHGANGVVDAAWLAMLAALRDTKLPRAWWDADVDGVLCDPDPGQRLPLGLKEDLPIVLSFGVFDVSEDGSEEGKRKEKTNFILTDPDAFEESLCDETITLSLAGNGKIVKIEKSGGGAVEAPEMKQLAARAEERRRECMTALKGV
ncbi:MAG: hypothetical protein Q9164_004658 [Protoblastenia rupestris]